MLLISTDPASNLHDVFSTELANKGVPIQSIENLVVANLDPVQAAAEYRESVVSPYRGKLLDAVIANMEEQLSGSCTVEIAAFNEFSNFITDKDVHMTIFSLIPLPPGIPCECSSYLPHGAISAIVHTVHPVLVSCPVWKAEKKSIKML